MDQQTGKGLGIKSEFIDEGFRMTKLRNGLIEILVDLNGPFSIDEMRGLLRKKGVPAHKVSLYRELVLFEEMGVIRPIHLQDHILRYELFVDHHHHVMCTNCKTIEEVQLECDLEKEEIIKQINPYEIVIPTALFPDEVVQTILK